MKLFPDQIFNEEHRQGEFLVYEIPKYLRGFNVSPVYEDYWTFTVERQKIFYRRLNGIPHPWSDDEILNRYQFTNAYRVCDRVSQYLIRSVIYKEDLPNTVDEVVFRTLLFKFFNKIETWELLSDSLGPITYQESSMRHIERILSEAKSRGQTIYSSAYVIPPLRGRRNSESKHVGHLELLFRMMRDKLPDRIANCRTMREGFQCLHGYPSIGNFLAYQYLIDINYSESTGFDENEFIVAGPGAKSGIRKCFGDTQSYSDEDMIRLMADVQLQEFERLNLDFIPLGNRLLQLIDCQNLFCEIDKYARVRYPAVAGVGNRRRIKHKFSPSLAPIQYVFPPKWNIKLEYGLPL